MSKEQRAKSLDLFYDEFGKESERAKVILSAAMLDEALLAVLEATFYQMPQVRIAYSMDQMLQ